MIDHPRFVSAEIEYTYLNGVKGNGPVRTLRLHVDAKLSDARLAAELLDAAQQRLTTDDRRHFDHISIVGPAADWPADRERRSEHSKDFLDALLGR